MSLTNNIFLSEEDKKNTYVGFSRDSFSSHKGNSGLKYYLIIMYLRKHMEIFGEVKFTLEEIVDGCGYHSNTRDKKAFRDYRQIIYFEIVSKGFAATTTDLETVKKNENIILKFSEEKSLFFCDHNFVQLSIEEFEKVLSIGGKTGKSILIGVYLFIKQFLPQNSATSISYPSIGQIAKSIGVSEPTVGAAISDLQASKMIYAARDMFVEDKNVPGTFVPIRNVYALCQEALNETVLKKELEKIYMRPIYKKNEIEGKIIYLPKRKGQ